MEKFPSGQIEKQEKTGPTIAPSINIESGQWLSAEHERRHGAPAEIDIDSDKLAEMLPESDDTLEVEVVPARDRNMEPEEFLEKAITLGSPLAFAPSPDNLRISQYHPADPEAEKNPRIEIEDAGIDVHKKGDKTKRANYALGKEVSNYTADQAETDSYEKEALRGDRGLLRYIGAAALSSLRSPREAGGGDKRKVGKEFQDLNIISVKQRN